MLGAHGGEATPLLARVLREQASALGEAAARALSASGDAAAEAELLHALAEGPLALRRAAAAALGRVGTRDAVAGLREAEADAELRATARQAIARSTRASRARARGSCRWPSTRPAAFRSQKTRPGASA